MINNRFIRDLPQEWWEGNQKTAELAWAGRQLAALELLPAPFPIQEWLSERDFAHVRQLFRIGGPSYGNLSVREDATSFWMSASGVDKGQMETIGRDMVLISDYLPEERAMQVRIPPEVQPRRASVDAIEHRKGSRPRSLINSSVRTPFPNNRPRANPKPMTYRASERQLRCPNPCENLVGCIEL